MPRYALAAALLVVLLQACSGSDDPNPRPAPRNRLDAANASYSIDGTTVTLVSGSADEPAASGSSSRTVTAITGSTGTGDLDGDGKPDLAVVITRSLGGSGTFYYVAALVMSDNSPRTALLLGDRISVSQVSTKVGAVTVTYLTRPEGAPFTAAPSVPASKTFSLAGGQLKPN